MAQLTCRLVTNVVLTAIGEVGGGGSRDREHRNVFSSAVRSSNVQHVGSFCFFQTHKSIVLGPQ